MQLVSTLKAIDPEKSARSFALLLALEKGYSSTVEKDGAARIVVASDGKAVRFET